MCGAITVKTRRAASHFQQLGFRTPLMTDTFHKRTQILIHADFASVPETVCHRLCACRHFNADTLNGRFLDPCFSPSTESRTNLARSPSTLGFLAFQSLAMFCFCHAIGYSRTYVPTFYSDNRPMKSSDVFGTTEVRSDS
jgi:hypothetical protein